jgi:hypothetical protein
VRGPHGKIAEGQRRFVVNETNLKPVKVMDLWISASMVVLYTGHVLKIALRDGLVSDPPVR